MECGSKGVNNGVHVTLVLKRTETSSNNQSGI